MNIVGGAEVIGDGLLIPRISAETSLEEPSFDGMGALVGPGLAPGTLSIAVTASIGVTANIGALETQKELTFILDHNYKPTTSGLTDMRLEEGVLVADQAVRDGSHQDHTEYRTEWPLVDAYEIPAQHSQEITTTGLVELKFDSLRPFFAEERRQYNARHNARRFVKEHGIAAYGMALRTKSQHGRQTRNRFAEYHNGAVIVAPTKLGQIAVVGVGRLGAMQYLLNEDGRRYSRGHHKLLVRDGKIYGKTGSQTSRFALAKLASRHIPKVPLSTTA